MINLSRFFFIVISLWLSVSCSKPVLIAEGIGGTGKTEEGIGGTGLIAEGIGGTGKTLEEGVGGTGIVGTITGFGSIWVNKAHVHFDKDTPVTINQQSATYGDFKIGQIVSLMSDKQTDGYQARSVDIVYEVIGPIQFIANDWIQVLGQRVQVSSLGHAFNPSNKPIKADQLKLGDWVSVSGYRKPKGEITATRLDLVPPRGHVELIGPIHQSADGQSIFNQTIKIDHLLADASDFVKPNTPKRVLVVGRYVDGMILVERVESDSIQAVIEEASELIWEGFVQEWDDDFYLNGIEFDFEEEFEFEDGELFILEGAFEDDEFILDDIYEDPEEFEEHEEFEEYEDEYEEEYEDDFEEFEDPEEFEEHEEFEEYEPEYDD